MSKRPSYISWEEWDWAEEWEFVRLDKQGTCDDCKKKTLIRYGLCEDCLWKDIENKKK